MGHRVGRLFRRPLPVRVALALLALGAILPSLIFFALQYHIAVTEKQADIERHGRAYARDIAYDVEREIAVKQAQLGALATSPFLRDGNHAELYQQARAAAENVTGWIALFRTDGTPIFNTLEPFGAKLAPAKNPELMRKVAETGRCQSTDLFTSDSRRRAMVSLVCPVTGTDLVLTGSLPVEHLGGILRRASTKAWLFTLIDRQGRVIAISAPENEEREWMRQRPSPAVEARMIGSMDGWLVSHERNEATYVGWQRLANGWTATAAVPRATVEGPLRHWQADVLWSLVVFSALAFVLAALVGEWIIRSMKQLSKSAGAIGAGGMIEPVDFSIQEVDQVGKALARACEDRFRGELANAHLAAVVTSSGDSIMSIDLEGTILSWNAAAERLYGYRADEAIGKPLAMLIPPVRLSEIDDKIAAARAGRSLRLETVRRRKDGSMVEVSLDAAPIRSSDGKLAGVSVIAHDISRRKRSEAHMQFVMRELSHRTKNLITVIIAMARRTARQSGDFSDFEAKFSGRLHGLARSHDLLVHMDWMGASIEELVRSQINPFILDPASLEVGGPQLLLRPEAVQNLGFALHELATNAQRHGSLSQPGGKVTIRWAVDKTTQGERRIHLSWCESGGPKVEMPERKGFGSTVIQQLTEASLNAKVTIGYECDGFRWDVDMPAKEILCEGAANAPIPLAAAARQAS